MHYNRRYALRYAILKSSISTGIDWLQCIYVTDLPVFSPDSMAISGVRCGVEAL